MSAPSGLDVLPYTKVTRLLITLARHQDDDLSMSDILGRLQADPVVMRDPQTLLHIRQLQSAHPIALFHRKVLELIGSDFTFAQADAATGCWAAVIELNSELQRLFGLSSGILAYYTRGNDLQLKTFERLKAQRLQRAFHNHLYFLSTPDVYAERKLSGWTLTEPYSVVLLPTPARRKTLHVIC